MDNIKNSSWSGLFLLGLFLALGIIIGTYILSNTVERIKLENQKIQVKGFAERTITSDIAVWEGQITTRSGDLASAYDSLQADVEQVLSYLKEQGISKDDVSLPAVSTSIQYELTEKGVRSNTIVGYILIQRVEITSSDVHKIADISSGVTTLIKQGIEFDSFPQGTSLRSWMI